MKIITFSAVAAGLFLSSARANLTITQKVEGMPGVTDMTFKIKGDKARIDATPQITTIMDSKTGDIDTLLNDKKQVIHLSGKKARALADMASKFTAEKTPAGKPKLVATGRKQTISGYKAEEYNVEGGTFPITLWITTKYPGYAEILKELAKMKPATAADVAHQGMPDYSEMPGLPMRMIIKIPGHGEMTNTIVSVKQDAIPEDQFAIPKGYSKIEMPDFSSGSPPFSHGSPPPASPAPKIPNGAP